MSINETYYPSKISLSVLKNKVYLLQFDQHGRTNKKILTRATCIIKAFEEGVVS